MSLFREPKNVIVYTDAKITQWIEPVKTETGLISVASYGSLDIGLDQFQGDAAYLRLKERIVPELKKAAGLKRGDKISFISPGFMNALDKSYRRYKDDTSPITIDNETIGWFLRDSQADQIYAYKATLRNDGTDFLSSQISVSNLDAIVNSFRKNGLIVTSVRPALLGLENLVSGTSEQLDTNVAVVHIGNYETSLSLYQYGSPERTIICNFGEELLVDHFTTELKITEEKAREHVKQIDFSSLDKTAPGYRVVLPHFGKLVKTVYNALDSYLSKFRVSSIDKIIVCGNSSLIPRICAGLETHLSVEGKVKLLSDIVTINDNCNIALPPELINSFAYLLIGQTDLDYLGANVRSTRTPKPAFLTLQYEKLRGWVKHFYSTLSKPEEVKKKEPEVKNQPGYVVFRDSRDDKTQQVYLCKNFETDEFDGGFITLTSVQNLSGIHEVVFKSDQVVSLFGVDHLPDYETVHSEEEFLYNAKQIK